MSLRKLYVLLTFLLSSTFLFSNCPDDTQVCLSLDGGYLNYNSSEDIAGFQFSHDGCVTGASGGDATANGFTVSASGTTGTIRATNDVTAFYSSDIRLKDNRRPIVNALEKVTQLTGIHFDWIAKQGIHDNEGADIGVIAQEVEEIFPEIVETRVNGFKAVRYDRLIAVIIQAIKELKELLDKK